MFEKNEKDFWLIDFIHKNQLTFDIRIGCFYNSWLGLYDCMFYLYLEKSYENYDSFVEYLNKEYNDMFLKYKKETIKNVKEFGVNYNSLINVNEFSEFAIEHAESGDFGEDIKYEYSFNEEELSKHIDLEYSDEVAEITQNSNNIVEYYEALCELKNKIKENLYENSYDFLNRERVDNDGIC